MTHGQRKKCLDFGGNEDHFALGLGLWLGGGQVIPCVISRFNMALV